MDDSSLLQRLIQLHVLLFAAYAYCVVVVRPLRPGWPRFLASLPAFVVFTISPWFVKDSSILSSGVNLTILWVANFKLLAYSGGRGALSHPALRSGLQWGALLVLPFFPAKSGRAPAKSPPGRVVLGLLVKLGVYLGLTAVLVAVEGLSPLAKHLCYAVHFWMFVSLCLDAGLPLAGQLVAGIPLQPAMDGPYKATSVREFWGRRYNQIVSATLQETVYKPIVEGRWVTRGAEDPKVGSAGGAESGGAGTQMSRMPSAGSSNVAVRAGPAAVAARASEKSEAASDGGANGGEAKQQQYERRRTPLWLALTGLAASFVVSGIMHEIALWFSCGGRLEGTFRMTSFFLVQPLLIVLQDVVLAPLARAVVPERIRSSWPAAVVQTVVTLAMVLASAELFWGSVESCNADKRGLEEIDGAMRYLATQARNYGLVA